MITVFGKPNCAYCTKAKNLLDINGIEYEYLDIMESEANYETLMMMAPNTRTVPQIFVGSVYHVGGFDNLQEAFEGSKKDGVPLEEYVKQKVTNKQ